MDAERMRGSPEGVPLTDKQTGYFCGAKALATEIDSRLNFVSPARKAHPPFVFLLLGPPSVGKTPLQSQLFQRWRHVPPRYLRVSGFVTDRNVRLATGLSECSAGAYDLLGVRTTLASIMRGESVWVREYDHGTGCATRKLRCIQPSDFLFLEGPIWLHCLDMFEPGYSVLLYPADVRQWMNAYIFRNTHFRNYTLDDARTAFRLALVGWIATLSAVRLQVDLAVAATFEGPTHFPVYRLNNSTNAMEVTQWMKDQARPLLSGAR